MSFTDRLNAEFRNLLNINCSKLIGLNLQRDILTTNDKQMKCKLISSRKCIPNYGKKNYVKYFQCPCDNFKF